MRILVILALVIPSVALAQPGPSSAPPGYGAPVYQPTYATPEDPMAFHRGITFEANLGVGFVHITDSTSPSSSFNSDSALAGANFGLGGWLAPNLALTVRIAGVQVKNGNLAQTDGILVNAFFGPSLQYWTDPHLWFGGGAGFSTFRYVGGSCSNNASSSACGTNGFGLDFRAGYSFGTTANTFNVSLELNPGFYSNNGSSGTATSVGFLVGYQYL